MNLFLYSLYQYASRHHADHFLLDKQAELADNEKMCVYALEALQAALPPPLLERLDCYTSGRDMREAIWSEAFFYSGLSMGLHLGGLGGSLTL